MKRDFMQLGLEVKIGQTCRLSRRGVMIFPSIEGIMSLFLKKGWMTAADCMLDDEDS